MMRRRRRRRRASWQFANASLMSVSSSVVTDFAWLLPPSRVGFLASNRNRDQITFAGCHLWLDFWWQYAPGHTTSTDMPDIECGIIKTTMVNVSTPDLSLVSGQWTQPATPASLTTWEDDEDDGTDSWLWSHHIKGSSPPNSIIRKTSDDWSFSLSEAYAVNQTTRIISSATSDETPNMVCRKFHVTQEWQPDVVVRSKRRLQKDEGILLYISGVTSAVGLTANLQAHYRTLVS